MPKLLASWQPRLRFNTRFIFYCYCFFKCKQLVSIRSRYALSTNLKAHFHGGSCSLGIQPLYLVYGNAFLFSLSCIVPVTAINQETMIYSHLYFNST